MTRVAKTLRELKESMGIRPLSRASGLKTSTIYNWMEGVTVPSMGQLQKLARYVNKDVTWFFESETEHADPSLTPDETLLLNSYRTLKRTNNAVAQTLLDVAAGQAKLAAVKNH